MTHLAVKDELLDAQILRTLGSAGAGGADIGECLTTAARLRGTDLDSWYDEWSRTASVVLAEGERQADTGHTVSARLAFFPASSYFRTAGVMLMGAPLDPRLVESNRRQTHAFRRRAALLEHPPDVIATPFEDTSLPGYFFRPNDDPRPRPTVILTGGYDGTAEELYFLTGAAALERGYNVVAFDGPGQGAALLLQGLVLRPDWEHVVTPVFEWATRRPEVDSERVALVGLSLGANLAPRAASVEHRLAACIADGGSYDLFADAVSRIPKPLRTGFVEGRPRSTSILRKILDTVAAKPTAGWALRRGQLVHGTASPLDYLRGLPDYSLEGHAQKIECPTFVCNAEGDEIGAGASRLVEALTCPTEFVTFMADTGAGDHCEAGARSLYHSRSFAWLDEVLQPQAEHDQARPIDDLTDTTSLEGEHRDHRRSRL
jgi:dienelactone hydrolase